MKALLILLFTIQVHAINTQAEGFQVPAGGALTVNVHSDCHTVNNGLGNDLFVPTRTAGEWTTFQGALPGTVTLSGCGAGSYTGSFNYGGAIWYMAQGLETCDGRCATLGGCNAGGFAAIANISDCQAVIAGVIGSAPTYNITPTDSTDANFAGMGCTFFENNAKSPAQLGAYRFTSAAPSCLTSNANAAYRRMCPCNI